MKNKYLIPIYGLVMLSLEMDDDTVDDQIIKVLKFVGILVYNVALLMVPVKALTEEYKDVATAFHETGFSVAIVSITLCGTILIIKGGLELINFMRRRLYKKD